MAFFLLSTMGLPDINILLLDLGSGSLSSGRRLMVKFHSQCFFVNQKEDFQN